MIINLINIESRLKSSFFVYGQFHEEREVSGNSLISTVSTAREPRGEFLVKKGGRVSKLVPLNDTSARRKQYL